MKKKEILDIFKMFLEMHGAYDDFVKHMHSDKFSEVNPTHAVIDVELYWVGTDLGGPFWARMYSKWDDTLRELKEGW